MSNNITVVKEVKTVTIRAEGIQPPSGGTGDMLAAVYDPTTKNTSAFDMSNMDEGVTQKILTSTERTQIATNKTNADASKVKTDFISVSQGVNLDTIESDTNTNNSKVGITPTQASNITTNNSKVGVTNEEQNTINTDTSGEPTGSDLILNVVSLTQTEYDAGTPVATTLYVITT